jgi:hypothetical protein
VLPSIRFSSFSHLSPAPLLAPTSTARRPAPPHRRSLLFCPSEHPLPAAVASHLDFKDVPARRSLLAHLVRQATVALLQLPLLPVGARSPPV